MGYPLKSLEGKANWQTYLASKTEDRYEVINGEIYDMSPFPSERHQRILGHFYTVLREKLKGKCMVYMAPLDVYLDEHNFVQPDLFVVCDRNKIKDRIYGPPDLVIEILSAHTVIKDKKIKKDLYQKFGIKEYIIIHPEENFLERYLLSEDRYTEPNIFGLEETLIISSLNSVEINLK